MKNNAILLSALLFVSSTALAQQPLLNAAETVLEPQNTVQPLAAPALTDQLENAAGQRLLQSAPAPIQQGVQTFEQAQQLKNAVDSVGRPSTVPAAIPGAAPVSPVSPTDLMENKVKQKAAQGLLNQLK